KTGSAQPWWKEAGSRRPPRSRCRRCRARRTPSARAGSAQASRRAHARVRRRRPRAASLMPEGAHAGEDARDAVLVGGGDYFVVAHAATGLDHGARAGLGERVETVAEWEECIRRYRRTGERQLGRRGFERGDAHAVDAAHLACADAERRAVAAEHDRIRFHELRHAPREGEIVPLLIARLPARGGAQLIALDQPAVR